MIEGGGEDLVSLAIDEVTVLIARFHKINYRELSCAKFFVKIFEHSEQSVEHE